MSDQFVAEIRVFAFNFAPANWAVCNGQLLPISQNTALFSLLGTTYGGNGTSNFGLPNLMGSIPLHVGRNQPGPGLSIYDLGQTGGSQNVTLLTSEMPMHSHTLATSSSNAKLAPGPTTQLGKPVTGTLSAGSQGLMYSTGNPGQAMPVQTLGVAGGSLPHNNMMPTLTLTYCIALHGIFPARN